MPSILRLLTLGAALVAAAPAPRSLIKRSTYMDADVEHTVIEDPELGASMDFVTNSGVCETTPGVNQYSGYISVGNGLNMCKSA